jgi:hypothetical protein
MAQGTWTGQAANDACAVYVKQAASPSGRELTVDVSLDKENMLNGVVRSADDRIVSARFYINTAGSTLTRSFAVTADAVDVDVDDQSAEPGRSAHLRAALTSNGFSFVEVESTRDGATHTKRCENVGKKR